MYITHAHTHVCLQAHANSPSHTRMRARTHACKNMHQCMHSRTQNPIRITCDSPCSPTEPAADPQAVATLRTVTAPRDVFRPCWQLADLGGRLRLREYRDASDLLSAPRLHPPPSSLSSPSELPRGTLTKAAVFPGRRGPEGCQQAPLHRRRRSGSRCGAAGVQGGVGVCVGGVVLRGGGEDSDARHHCRRRVSTGLERSRRPAAGFYSTPGHTGGGQPAGRTPRGRPLYGVRRHRDDRTDYVDDRQTAPPHLPLARAGRTARRGPRCKGGPATGATATRNPPVAQPGEGPPRQARGHPDCGLRQATPPPWRNGIPDHTGCPAGEGTQLTTGGSTQGRRVTAAVNKTEGSGGPRPAPAQRRLGTHRTPSRGG
jgi:hypothetical protein